jgi:hypothetical protein
LEIDKDRPQPLDQADKAVRNEPGDQSVNPTTLGRKSTLNTSTTCPAVHKPNPVMMHVKTILLCQKLQLCKNSTVIQLLSGHQSINPTTLGRKSTLNTSATCTPLQKPKPIILMHVKTILLCQKLQLCQNSTVIQLLSGHQSINPATLGRKSTLNTSATCTAVHIPNPVMMHVKIILLCQKLQLSKNSTVIQLLSGHQSINPTTLGRKSTHMIRARHYRNPNL